MLKERRNLSELRRGQITLFVIIGLVIIAGVAGYFAFKTKFQTINVSSDFKPIEEYFSSCIKTATEQ